VLSSNHEYGRSGLDAREVTEATIHARAELHELVDGLRSLAGPWQELRLVATGSHIGIREGRRIHARYTVSVDDALEGAKHEDAVCHVTVGIDVHSPDPAATKSYSQETRWRTQPYDIPVGALIARDVDGLLLAGRCIGGDFLAHSSYRMTGLAATMGQGAGALAAVAAQTDALPHDVPWPAVRAAITSLDPRS